MPRRGPYKQYEVDASVAIPRSTLHDRRKRRLVEVNTDDRDHVEDNTHPFALHGNDQIYLDDNNMQVRCQHDIHIIVIINNSISY